MTTKKIRFNILDVLIILVTLLTIATVIFLLFPQVKHVSDNQIAVRYTVELKGCDENVAQEFAKAFENNETLKVGESELFDATILSCEIEPATVYLTNHATKQITERIDSTHFDIKLTLRTDATETEDEILFGDTPIRVGSEITVKCRKASARDLITKLIID